MEKEEVNFWTRLLFRKIT